MNIFHFLFIVIFQVCPFKLPGGLDDYNGRYQVSIGDKKTESQKHSVRGKSDYEKCLESTR